MVVAVSGGSDSLVLLHILLALQDRLQCKLHAATLDHGLRGQAGADDAAYVEAVCAAWGVPWTREHRSVQEVMRAEQCGVEEAARSVRYQFLQDTAAAVGADRVAVGHHADDQAETLAEGYFAGESRKIWELTRVMSYDMPGYTRAEVDAEFAKMEQILIAERNRAWIPVLTGAAQEGPVFAAFGALHLSGEAGMLNLLNAEGFALEELSL